jgi:tetratricopeptide (TPR) repeat protein
MNEIEKIFSPNNKYTFLLGAGISMDPPTSLPSANEIVKRLVELFAPEEEVRNLMLLHNLRYEMIIEHIQKKFDPDLTFLDYFEIASEPNFNHLFFAYLIKKGQFVVTTNFDYGIEEALLMILPKRYHKKITPIITKEDYFAMTNPSKQINRGFYPIFKIHGSKYNIITHKKTLESLVTTLTALGKNRTDGETFAIESFKKTTMNELMKERTLVVMGYSGGDDFDITPLLNQMTNFQKIIWIEHINRDDFELEQIQSKENDEEENKKSRSNLLLREIAQSSGRNVYQIKTNTSIFIRNYLWKQLIPNKKIPQIIAKKKEKEIPPFKEWIASLKSDYPDRFKYQFVAKIYYSLGQIEDVERVLSIGMELARGADDLMTQSFFLAFSGLVAHDKGDYENALTYYSEALLIDEKFGNYEEQAALHSNLGDIYRIKEDYDLAIQHFEKGYDIAEKINNLEKKVVILTEIALTALNKKDDEKAKNLFNNALEEVEKLGDLYKKADILNNLGWIYLNNGDLENAEIKLQECMKITTILGDLQRKAHVLTNIASLKINQNKFEEALELSKNAIEIAKKVQKKELMANIYNSDGLINENIANIKKRFGNPQLAQKFPDMKENGILFEVQKNYDKALLSYQKARDIFLSLGKQTSADGITSVILKLNLSIGQFKLDIGDFKEAAELLTELSQLLEKEKDTDQLCEIYASIANAEFHQQKYDEALKYFQMSIDITDETGDQVRVAAYIQSKAIIFNTIGKSENALDEYMKALKIFRQQGDLVREVNTLMGIANC